MDRHDLIENAEHSIAMLSCGSGPNPARPEVRAVLGDRTITIDTGLEP
jgi:hypothetical protein